MLRNPMEDLQHALNVIKGIVLVQLEVREGLAAQRAKRRVLQHPSLDRPTHAHGRRGQLELEAQAHICFIMSVFKKQI